MLLQYTLARTRNRFTTEHTHIIGLSEGEGTTIHLISGDDVQVAEDYDQVQAEWQGLVETSGTSNVNVVGRWVEVRNAELKDATLYLVKTHRTNEHHGLHIMRGATILQQLRNADVKVGKVHLVAEINNPRVDSERAITVTY